jgi:hypothetical protein
MAFALNAFYNSDASSTDLLYWYSELDSGLHQNSQAYLDGMEITGKLRNYHFSGESQEGILLYYNFQTGNCLWLPDEKDRLNQDLPDLVREALPLADLNRISSDPDASVLPSLQIFGNEPTHDWCYYFQLADLAWHLGDWSAILEINTTVTELGFEPNNKLEWFPFVEAYAHFGQWDQAADLTLAAYTASPVTRKTYCAVWDAFQGIDDFSNGGPAALTEVTASLGCP